MVTSASFRNHNRLLEAMQFSQQRGTLTPKRIITDDVFALRKSSTPCAVYVKKDRRAKKAVPMFDQASLQAHCPCCVLKMLNRRSTNPSISRSSSCSKDGSQRPDPADRPRTAPEPLELQKMHPSQRGQGGNFASGNLTSMGTLSVDPTGVVSPPSFLNSARPHDQFAPPRSSTSSLNGTSSLNSTSSFNGTRPPPQRERVPPNCMGPSATWPPGDVARYHRPSSLNGPPRESWCMSPDSYVGVLKVQEDGVSAAFIRPVSPLCRNSGTRWRFGGLPSPHKAAIEESHAIECATSA